MLAGRTSAGTANANLPAPADLVLALESYLADNPAAAILEDGRVLFDMRTARFSITESHGRCLLQLWSEERNVVRTVVDVQHRAQCLRLLTRRMGAAQPTSLEVVPNSDRRTPTTRDTARRNYRRLLERALTREFPGWKVDGLRTAMDLEHSFGPAYVRGHLLRGTEAHAVIGVSAAEPASTIDGVLTLGILWLEYCRSRGDKRRHFGGLTVVIPEGAWRVTAERMAWLNQGAAGFRLYTLNERSEELVAVDFQDTANTDSRLVQAFSPDSAIERCREGLDRVLALVPPGEQCRVELYPRSAAQVGLLLHGLEFARVRCGAATASFAHQMDITFGAGAHETRLQADTEELCRDLLQRLFAGRHAQGTHTDPLFRLQPERWLESRLRQDIRALLPGLRGEHVYSQVPAMAHGDRGMLDLLAQDRNGRLVVLELKADEDLHLPLQTLDYWIRVRALLQDFQTSAQGRLGSAFQRMGYFPGTEVSDLPPRMILAAPALRIHPANDTVLRYLSPQIEWELIALAESWRTDLKIVFRKSSDRRELPQPSITLA